MKKPLFLIIILALLVRMYGIATPVADWHSFRQADTASVTREYVKHGIDLLRPTYHDHSNIQSGEDNPLGYRMVEFPLVNGLIALLIRAVPVLPLVPVSRFISVLFSLGTLISLYYLTQQLSGKKVALVSVLLFAVLPYGVFYSRTILPEPAMLFFATFSFTAFFYWLTTKRLSWYILSFTSFAIALLLKPFVLFLAPVYAGLVAFTAFNESIRTFTFRHFFVTSLLAAPGFFAALVPMLGWQWWIARFPEGIPARDWLFNGNLIRFRPAWFRWLFYERITKLILGYVGSVFLLVNIWPLKKDLIVYGAWWASILIYFSVIASGNVQHDYYQVLALPIISLSVGRGLVLVYDYLKKRINMHTSLAVVSVITATMLFFAWNQVQGYYNVNHWEYIRAGQAVDKLTPPDAKVIAPAFGDTHFLFQTNRTGWPIGFEIEDKIAKGATHYITTSYDDEARMLEKQYQVIKKTDEFILIDLRSKK
ncbi:MAG TPA: glycosyltransferase family 39 protein [Patescibacteria group bacterium]